MSKRMSSLLNGEDDTREEAIEESKEASASTRRLKPKKIDRI